MNINAMNNVQFAALSSSYNGPVKARQTSTVVKPLFDAMLWTINGPRASDFSLVTANNTMSINFTSYHENTLVGIIWQSRDLYSHAALKYNDYFDYSGIVLTLAISVSATMPIFSDATKELTLTVEYNNGTIFYVPLSAYCDNPTGRTGTFVLPFDALGDGFGNFLDPSDISTMFIGLVAESYVLATEEVLLAAPEDCSLTIGIVSVTAPKQFTASFMNIAEHQYGIATSYDDIYNLSPERIVKDLYAVGYRGRVNHYCGMSKYPYKTISALGLRMNEALNQKVNPATKEWHSSFCYWLKKYNQDVIFSVSFEMFSVYANPDYAQRDSNGVLGTTGYEPPSYLISPCIQDGMNYLSAVFVEFADILAAEGLPVIIQVGEPWWWWQGATRKPCVYDYPTKVKFNAETGLFAPDFDTIDSALTGTPYDEFKTFLQKELGESVLFLANAVKTKYPGALATALFFLPSILTENAGIMQMINYPKAQYSYPNLDFFMTEAYDWLIAGEVQKTAGSVTIPNLDLGYPLDKIEYLCGFVPDDTLAAAFGWTILDVKYKYELWARLGGGLRVAKELGVGRQYVWASPQAMRDGVILEEVTLDTKYSKSTFTAMYLESVYKPLTFVYLGARIDDHAPVFINLNNGA